MEYTEIAEAIDALEKKFNGQGRVLIRPSGTEPLVRVMIEGKDQAQIEKDARELAELIQTRCCNKSGKMAILEGFYD